MSNLNAIADDLESLLPLCERYLPGIVHGKLTTAIANLRGLAPVEPKEMAAAKIDRVVTPDPPSPPPQPPPVPKPIPVIEHPSPVAHAPSPPRVLEPVHKEPVHHSTHHAKPKPKGKTK